MSWNEPGDRDDKKKDPWGRENEQSPPNIDEALRQLQQKLKGLFGGKEGSKNNYSKPIQSGSSKGVSISLLLGIALAIYIIAGIFVVEPAEEAVILRFGRYVRTEGPGPHWIAPLIETKQVLNVKEVKTSKRGGPMLTKDENIVNAEIAVQYRIGNARDYLFNLVHPVKTLEQVSDSALRAVVGQSTLNEVLTSGRSEIGLEIRKQVEQNLNNYHSGLEISDLAVQQTKAPEEVKAAFDDAIKAQQDEERLVNEAEAYAHKIIPIAEGHAKRTSEEAAAYQQQVILEAEGKTAKFSKILPEYQKAPQVTRDRLFIDTLQDVYANSAKVLVDVAGGNNVMYLPLDKLVKKMRPAKELPKEEETAVVSNTDNNNSAPLSRRIIERPSYENPERPLRGEID